jgi:hypothetical protein
MKKLIPYIAIAVFLCSCQGKNTGILTDSTATGSSTTYAVPDEQAIKKAVDDAYGAISFKKGDTPRYDSIKNYFIPKAQLINFRSDSMQVTSIGQFVYLYRSFIEGDSVKMFYEKELYGKTEQFGKVASRVSTYKTFLNTMDKPEELGVNLFQLVKTPEGWKVSSIIWDVERKGLKIPAYYLPK